MALSTISGTTGITDATITSAKLADFAAAVDLNGVELILDADQDTSITADTDDRIDFKIAGVEHISISNSSGDTIIKPMVDVKDIIFQQYDGNKIFEINDGNFVGIGGNSTAAGEIRIYEDTDDGSHYTGFKAGNNTASVAYVLPTADGTSGHQLTTDGSGTLSWSSAGVALSNDTNNRVVTADGSGGINGEANLTFDGSTLAVTGAITGSSDLTLQDDLILDSDSAVLSFGEDNEITVTHVADTGLNIKHTATGDDKPIIITLQTGETDIAANDVIGTINFQAPDEGTGTDAILVAAGISAISEGDFSSSANATKLSFKTAVSAAASETMSLTSNGDLFLAGGLIDLKNDGNAVSQIKFYCESSNAHAQTLIGAPHSEGATNVLTLPGTGGDARLVSTTSTATLTNKTLTTPVIAEIDSGANITLDATADIILDAGGANITFKDDGTSILDIANNSSDVELTVSVADKNFAIKGTDGSSAITALDIDMALAGKATFNGAVVVGGDLTVNGTTTTVNSTTVTIDDPIFTLGGDTAPGSDDNKDRGIEFRYHNGSAAKIGFFGFDDSTSKFTFIADASNSSEVFSGSAGNVAFGDIAAAGDVSVGDDLTLGSDAAVLNFGADSDVSLTHVADTALLLNSSRQLQFGDSGTYIHQSADGVLDLVSDTEIEINATTIDINGNVEISGDLTVSGDDITMGTNTSGHVMVADGTNFNPVAISGDISIAANGAVTIASTAVETSMIAADAITEAKIADNAVENEHINDNVISGQTALTSGLATTDELLISDGGTIKRMDVSLILDTSSADATALAIALG